MATLKELRTRIASVKNTRKITAAMSQIAAARLRKAQDAVTDARPYGQRLAEVVEHLLAGIDPMDSRTPHPLLQQREAKRVGLVLLTADRGLCGGFNASANRAARDFITQREDEGQDVVAIAIGKKGRSFLGHRGKAIESFHEGPTLESLMSLSRTIANEIIAMFTREAENGPPRVDAFYLIYNHFVSVLSQETRTNQILPFRTPDSSATVHAEPTLEPSRTELLSHLLPVAIESSLQQAMFESIAAEIAARRTAMDAATDNATELIGDLTLTFNRERQAAITKELMEIIGGAEALKG
jgi:F-type H+-transporting ATPase subunit gamma